MQVGQFPASAANSLIEGYCDDFVALAVILAQTLEQVSIRGISMERSRPSLGRIENGMRELADAIHELLDRGQVSSQFPSVLGREPAPAPPTPAAPAPAAPASAAPPAASAAPPAPQPVLPIAAARPTPTPAPAPAPRVASPGLRGPASPPPIAPTAPPAPTRAPAASGPAPGRAPRADSPLVAAFLDLARSRRTGTLFVQAGEETLGFELANGCIQLTASDRPPAGERIGEILVELGSCTRERITSAVTRGDAAGSECLGDRLVKAGVVTNAQLVVALEHQVRRRFQRAIDARATSHEFVEGKCLQGDGRICVAIQAMLPPSRSRP